MADIVRYDSSLSATAASVKFGEDLTKAGLPYYGVGQGAETATAPEGLFPADMHVTYGPKYNGQAKIGGDLEARTVMADWATQFLGIPATASNTFVLAQNGRVSERRALTMAYVANGHSNDFAFPRLRWPMYDDIMRDNFRRYKIAEYESPLGDYIGNDLQGILRNHPVALTINTPQNPNGKIYSTNWMQELGDELEKVNARVRHKTDCLLDIPYFYALRVAPTERGHHFEGGYEHLTKPDSKTHYHAIISFSKALGLAEPGLTALIVHPEIASKVKGQLTQDGGTSYSQGFYDGVVQAFRPAAYDVHRRHYAELAQKYEINFGHLIRDFGNQVVDGNPGMTALLSLPNILGKSIEVGGHLYVFNKTADFIEYAGNQGVLAVDNGQDGTDALVRVAAAPANDVHDKASKRLKEITQKVQFDGLKVA